MRDRRRFDTGRPLGGWYARRNAEPIEIGLNYGGKPSFQRLRTEVSIVRLLAVSNLICGKSNQRKLSIRKAEMVQHQIIDSEGMALESIISIASDTL